MPQSWEIFRCEVDCNKDPSNCIGETLYKSTVDALASGGYLAAGYDTIHIDDCWEARHPPRDASGQLVPNATRFPSGFDGLSKYCHDRSVKFGIYSDEGTETCGGYPGSKGHEATDAATFARWGCAYTPCPLMQHLAFTWFDLSSVHRSRGSGLKRAGLWCLPASGRWRPLLGYFNSLLTHTSPASRIPPYASHLAPHTSSLTPHASRLAPHSAPAWIT